MSDTSNTQSRNVPIIAEYREKNGKLSGYYEDSPILLLTTVGRISGKRHTTPLRYLESDGLVVVFGSAAGNDRDPDWLLNLRKNPLATVELEAERFEVNARILTGPPRDELYAKHASRWTQFIGYQEKTTRIIPAIVLDRV